MVAIDDRRYHDLIFGVVNVKQLAGMVHNDLSLQQRHLPNWTPRAKNQALAKTRQT
jgi:hypothetical protein